MCELFAFSGEHPALLRMSVHEFAQHGGGGHNAEGWGIAHYVDGDVRLLKESGPARESGCLRFIEEHPLRSALVISHIRRATQGAQSLRNCQPFVRELGGHMHVFAHNGDLDRRGLARLAQDDGFRPVGETDSELAFCVLLQRLRSLWLAGRGAPDLQARHAAVAALASELRALGPANFIYADGDALFAHGHKRVQSGGGIRPPGLHVLQRDGRFDHDSFQARGMHIGALPSSSSQTLLASVPLTADTGWRALAEGELLVVRAGDAAPPGAA